MTAPNGLQRTALWMTGPFRQIENRFRGMKRQFLMVQQSFCLAEENLIKTQSLCRESVRYWPRCTFSEPSRCWSLLWGLCLALLVDRAEPWRGAEGMGPWWACLCFVEWFVWI